MAELESLHLYIFLTLFKIHRHLHSLRVVRNASIIIRCLEHFLLLEVPEAVVDEIVVTRQWHPSLLEDCVHLPNRLLILLLELRVE